MTLPQRSCWAVLLAAALLSASCQLPLPGIGRLVVGPTEAPLPHASPLPEGAVVLATPTPTLRPGPVVTVTPTATATSPAVIAAATPTATPPPLAPPTGWPLAPSALAAATTAAGLAALGLGWALRRGS